MWRVPLKANVQNENTNTIVFNRPNPAEPIANVFELPSTEKTVKYFHAAAGYPTKETWVKAIRAGNYATWPGLSVKGVNECYPETDETPKGQMQGLRQGVRSTKVNKAIQKEYHSPA